MRVHKRTRTGEGEIIHTNETSAGGGADALLVEAARLRGLPNFDAAVRHYSATFVGFRERTRLVSKLMAYQSRFRVVGYLLHLHAANQLTGDGEGVSYGSLFELCVRRGEASPRVVKTMLALLGLGGFLETARSASDRRIKLYRPTARLMDFGRSWFGHTAGTLDLIEPEARRRERLLAEPAFFLGFLVSAGQEHADEPPPADRMPEFIGFFGTMEGAGAVVSAIALADIDGVPAPSRARLARQFGLSKTQVARVIEAGAGLGYFELDAAAVPSPTGRLRQDYRRWISIELAFCARHLPMPEQPVRLAIPKGAPRGESGLQGEAGPAI
ncbi:MAG TPA: hypothetical protein VGV07_08970 [Devosia sp.]|uniref:hypothetical protein n=1 Tax=Devosia sp. TaxID=1871048 RepID=UPI002DDD1F90|nr:hypothetical protein [Devosia sp.]HEV2515366.1 hypothetical protein [Devosia sp.]